MTAGVIALVVVACSLFLGLISSLRRTLVSSGDPRNLVVMRKGSDNDGSSQLVARGLPGDQVLRRHRARRAGSAAGLAGAGRAAVLPHPARAGARTCWCAASSRSRCRCTATCASAEGRMFNPSSGEAVVGQGRDGPLPRRDAGQRARVRPRPLEGGRHPRVRRLVVRERGVGRRARAGQRRQATVPLLGHPPACRRRRRHGGAGAAHRRRSALRARGAAGDRRTTPSRPSRRTRSTCWSSASRCWPASAPASAPPTPCTPRCRRARPRSARCARSASRAARSCGRSRSRRWRWRCSASLLGAVLAVLLARADRAAHRRHRLRRRDLHHQRHHAAASRRPICVAALVLALVIGFAGGFGPGLARGAHAADRGAAQGVSHARTANRRAAPSPSRRCIGSGLDSAASAVICVHLRFVRSCLAAKSSCRADLSSLRIERDRSTRRAPRRRRRWWIPSSLVLLAVAAVGVVAHAWPARCRSAWRTRRAAPPARPDRCRCCRAPGYIVTGDRYVSVGVRVAGRIDRYFVEEGQSVKKGDPLVQLDDRDYRAAVAATEARIASARANLALAEADLARGAPLHTQGVISQQEYDVLANKADGGARGDQAARGRARAGQGQSRLHDAARAGRRRRAGEAQGGRRDRRARRLRRLGRSDPPGQPHRHARRGRRQRGRPQSRAPRPAGAR